MPSGIRPLPCVARIAWHRLVLRDRQNLHCRHSGVYSGMTWSPVLSVVTPGPDVDHDARALVAEDGREDAFRVGARQRVVVGVADAGGLDLDQHLAGARAFEVDGFDRQGRAGFPGDGGTGLHGGFLGRRWMAAGL